MEDADWGYCRTRRVLLRNPVAELGFSVFSARLDHFTAPNRDYPFEGFSANFGGENWKLVDALFACLKIDGDSAVLEPVDVVVSPWSARYNYSAKLRGIGVGGFSVEYSLYENSDCPAMSARYFYDGTERKASVAVAPAFDVRFMYDRSSPEGAEVEATARGFRVSKDGKAVKAVCRNPCKVSSSRRVVGWDYKLGSGWRVAGEGGIRFSAESRRLLVAGEMEFPIGKKAVEVVASSDCASGTQPGRFQSDEKRRSASAARVIFGLKPLYSAAASRWGRDAAAALAGRAYCLLRNFSWSPSAGAVPLPDAGAFWFRTVWLRDAFEAVNGNFGLFYSMKKRWLRQAVLSSLSLERNGLVPNRFVESGSGLDYGGIDPTLLCYLAAFNYAEKAGDKLVGGETKKHFLSSLSAFSTGGFVTLSSDGLLECPPNYSWVASLYRRSFLGGVLDVPSRIPAPWVDDDLLRSRSPADAGAALSRKAKLAEVNAQWILVLQAAARAGVEEAVGPLSLAKSSFRKAFFRNGFVSHISRGGVAFEGGGGEGAASSMGIVAMSLLSQLFTREERKRALEIAAERLFVRRGGRLFGVLVKDSRDRIYLSDAQYHSAVVWPRDTPYLLGLLLDAGRRAECEELLLSNLGHQMEEGAVFYNAELFSLPEGKNPYPQPRTAAFPVPVKNPAQLWSQWVSPYQEFLGV